MKNLNKYVIIGSTAIKHQLEKNSLDIPPRFTKRSLDLDILVKPENQKDVLSEFPYADIVCGDSILDDYHFNDIYASLNEIYTLKMSHIFWDHGGKPGQWFIHMNDIVALRKMDCEIIEPLYTSAKNEWIKRFGKPGASLNANKEEFFSTGVDRYVDHDSLHETIAFYDYPIFYDFLKEGEEVLTDKTKFFNMSFEKQLRAVQEEAMVLALERDIIPLKEKPNKFYVHNSYIKNIKKLVTQYSSGWFPKFISENWELVAIRISDKDPLEDFIDNLGDSGKIRPGDLWDKRSDLWWGKM